jgi:hypothetical protein
MTVALPDGGIVNAQPRFLDRGGLLRATLGGADQRLDRIGSRWGVTVQTKPMKGEEARIWASRLVRGVREKASLRLSQPGIVFADFTPWTALPYGFPTQPANSEVLVLYIAEAAVNRVVKEGQFLSFIKDGKRYLHQAIADAAVDAAGLIGINIQPPLRVPLTHMDAASPVTLNNPRIEGYIAGEEATWTIDNAKIYGFSFSIDEAQ